MNNKDDSLMYCECGSEVHCCNEKHCSSADDFCNCGCCICGSSLECRSNDKQEGNAQGKDQHIWVENIGREYQGVENGRIEEDGGGVENEDGDNQEGVDSKRMEENKGVKRERMEENLGVEENEDSTVKEEVEENKEEMQRLFGLVDIEIGRKTKRPMCSMCSRPQSVCWCSGMQQQLQHVSSRLLILQHPHEEKRSLRTAPMLENALPHCRIVKGKRFNRTVFPELQSCSPNTVMLFPGPDAVDVTSLPTVRDCGPYTIVMLDGTWQQARAIMHNTKQLHHIKKVVVHSNVVSQYVIRTQPSDAALSTVESAALALAALEDDASIYTTLVAPLATLCSHQLSHGAVVHHSKERRYKEEDSRVMGKRTAKAMTQCGAQLEETDERNTEDDNSSCSNDGSCKDACEDRNSSDKNCSCKDTLCEDRNGSYTKNSSCIDTSDDNSSSCKDMCEDRNSSYKNCSRTSFEDSSNPSRNNNSQGKR